MDVMFVKGGMLSVSIQSPLSSLSRLIELAMLSLFFGRICCLFLDLHFRVAVLSSILKPLLSFLSLALRAVFMITQRASLSFDSFSLHCR